MTRAERIYAQAMRLEAKTDREVEKLHEELAELRLTAELIAFWDTELIASHPFPKPKDRL